MVNLMTRKPMTMKKPIAQFTNSFYRMTAFVVQGVKGYNVTMRDDDSMEFLPTAICGVADLEDAKKRAQLLVR